MYQPSVDDAEQTAMTRLKPQLSEHVDLVNEGFHLIGTLVSFIPETTLGDMSKSLVAAIRLLLRLSNDLLCIEILAIRGYPLQCLTLASAAYEAAYTIGYIGDDDILGQEWLAHRNPTNSFRGVWDLTQQAITKLGVPSVDEQTAIEYRVYSQLCMAKYINPILERNQGVTRVGEKLVATNGPDTSEEAVRAMWFALEHLAGFVLVALSSFFMHHFHRYVSSDIQEDARSQLEQLGEKRKELEAKAVSRWGTIDAFAGEWRT